MTLSVDSAAGCEQAVDNSLTLLRVIYIYSTANLQF